MQSTRSKDWIENGQSLAFAKAKSAKTESYYWRTLTFYINGFQDGYLTARRNGSVGQVWPGFLTSTDASGVIRITVSTIAAAPISAQITDCDGVPVGRLLDERVHPYLTNASIPHQRLLTASYLFVDDANDRPNLMKTCTISLDDKQRRTALDWGPIDKMTLAQRLPEAQGLVEPPLAVRQIDGIWFVSLPSFNWWGDKAAKMQAMVGEVKRQAVLHSAPRVVIDVRVIRAETASGLTRSHRPCGAMRLSPRSPTASIRQSIGEHPFRMLNSPASPLPVP